MYEINKLFIFCIFLILTPSCVTNKLPFKVKFWNANLPNTPGQRKIFGISLTECIEECGKRLSCKYTVYLRRGRTLCQLFGELDLTKLVETPRGYIVISRQDIDTSLIADQCVCNEGQVCNNGACEHEECATPTLSNGKYIGNMYSVGSTLRIFCDHAFTEINRQTSIQCEESGSWNYSAACSQTIECGDLLFANGELVGSDNGVGATKTIVCHSGYEEEFGETVVQCENDGSWNHTPSCIIKCGDLLFANGELVGTDNGVGAIKTIVCHTGYEEESGLKVVQCENDGSWNYTPSCIIKCADLLFANGELIDTVNGVGATKTIVCHPGYEEEFGETVVQCENDGSWNHTSSCIIKCGDLLFANGELVGSDNGVGATKTIVCHTGYEEESGLKVVQCENDGSWNHTPSCIIKCGDMLFANGELVGTDNGVGATKTIDCHHGYEEESGKTLVQCENDGNWNYLPTCKAICPSDSGHSENNFHIKVFHTIKLKYSDAKANCSADGGGLVKIDTSWKMGFVSDILNLCSTYSKHDYWTDGMTDDDEWLFSDGTNVPMGTRFWHNGQPGSHSNDDECTKIEKDNGVFLWDDKRCKNKLRFICEY